MMWRVLWIAPPVAAVCSLLPYAQLATIDSCSGQIVSCTAQVSALTLPKVNAAVREGAGKMETRTEHCVVLQPDPPYGWDFDTEVTRGQP